MRNASRQENSKSDFGFSFAGMEEALVTGVSDSVKPDTCAFACSLPSVSEYVACPGGDLSLDFQNSSFSPQERTISIAECLVELVRVCACVGKQGHGFPLKIDLVYL